MSSVAYSALVFAIAALGGGFLATRHFMKKDLPMPVVLLHGALAATGLVLLGYASVQGTTMPLANIALVLFLVAALGGFYLFSKTLRKQPLPSPVIVIHAGVAVLAFLLLCGTLV